MSRVARSLRCMGKPRLDMTTADRILAGTVDPADAPPGFEAVVVLIGSARAPHAPTIMLASGRAPAPRSRRRQFMLAAPPFRSRLTIAAAAATLVLASGTAYATGLPAAASATARGVLHSLGVSTGSPAKTHSQPAATHGATVSSTVRTTTATGAAKGAQIAALASNGRSRAGQGGGDSATAKSRADAKGSGHGHGAEISALAHATTGTAGAKGATISATASNGRSHAGRHGHNGQGGSSGGSAPAAGSHGGASSGHGSGSGHGGS